MVTSLFKHERIRTTDAKAKELRRWADRIITLAKKGDLHARRQALAIVREKDVVHKLFEQVQERFGKINGGYTRIIKIGKRPGDAAAVSLIELISADEIGKKKKAKPAAKKLDKPAAKKALAKETKAEADEAAAEAPEEKTQEAAAEKEPEAESATDESAKATTAPEAKETGSDDESADAALEADGEAKEEPAQETAPAEEDEPAEEKAHKKEE
jgi:large subunit ribosomal protein L17